MTLKFKILQENLQKGLEAVGPAVASRTTMPALQDVLITAQNQELVLSATDLELRIDAKVSALIEREGQAMLKYQTFLNQVRPLPSEPVEVEILLANTETGKALSITCGHASAQLHCEDETAFPPRGENDIHTQATIPADVLGRAIRMVSCCVAPDDNRPSLTTVGLWVNPADGILSTVAADGFRLARMQAPCEIESDGFVAICIPRNAAREIERALSRHSGNVLMTLDSERNHARFALSDGNLVLTTQLLAQEPEDRSAVIPAGPMTCNLTVEGGALRVGIQSVASISQMGNSMTRLYAREPSTEFPDGALGFAANADGEFARNVVPVEGRLPSTAPLVYTAINHRYLADFMSAVGAETPVEVGMDDESSPIRLTNSDGSYVYVAMPMHADWLEPNAPDGIEDHPSPDQPGEQGDS